MGRIETTNNAAEVTAVFVEASAVERAGTANANFLTDHHAVVSPVAKFFLWREFRAILRRQSFEVSWVPAHGRAWHLAVPDFWRRLNKLADEAASSCSLTASDSTSAWSAALSRQPSLVARILHYKVDVFDDLSTRSFAIS